MMMTINHNDNHNDTAINNYTLNHYEGTEGIYRNAGKDLRLQRSIDSFVIPLPRLNESQQEAQPERNNPVP